MATLKQINANRANAQKSTGPRTPEGKDASRFNALKTGIFSKAEVLPNELTDNLDLLTAEFYDQYQPATPEQRTLVDIVIRNEWLLRRTAALEADYWDLKRRRNHESPTPLDDRDLITRDYTRLQWRLNSIQRNLFAALDRLAALQATHTKRLTPKLASFKSTTKPEPKTHPEPARNPEAYTRLEPQPPTPNPQPLPSS